MSGVRPDYCLDEGDGGRITLGDICTITGRNARDYRGFALLLMPSAERGPVELLSDAPSAGAIVSLLGLAITGCGDKIQLAGEGRWQH